MWKRTALLGGLAVLVALSLGGTWWWFTHEPASAEVEAETDEDLPVPPIPPRIAQGEDYEKCLGMLAADPSGAHDFADAWIATGGGDGARHCLGLADIELGDVETGADALDKLAANSQAPAIARATIFGQAGMAWIMAGAPDRALASTTLALSMTPDDADLLIDRSIAEASLTRYTEAVADLDRALQLDPRRGEALVFRSAAYRQLNKLDLAQDDIDRAVAMDPENADALLERGILRQRRGDQAGARGDFEQAMRLSPDTETGSLAQQNLALLDAGPDKR